MEHHHPASIHQGAIVVVRHAHDQVAVSVAVHITGRGHAGAETLSGLNPIQQQVRYGGQRTARSRVDSERHRPQQEKQQSHPQMER